MCPVCREYEVGSFPGGTEYYCSATCEGIAHAEEMALRISPDECGDGEPEGPYDLSDDAEALASAGWGTDEDYGYYGEEY
jgi:hypothetical protein